MRYASAIVFFFVTVVTLAGCGQTGPLYMPDEQPPAAQPPVPVVATPDAEPSRTAP